MKLDPQAHAAEQVRPDRDALERRHEDALRPAAQRSLPTLKKVVWRSRRLSQKQPIPITGPGRLRAARSTCYSSRTACTNLASIVSQLQKGTYKFNKLRSSTSMRNSPCGSSWRPRQVKCRPLLDSRARLSSARINPLNGRLRVNGRLRGKKRPAGALEFQI